MLLISFHFDIVFQCSIAREVMGVYALYLYTLEWLSCEPSLTDLEHEIPPRVASHITTYMAHPKNLISVICLSLTLLCYNCGAGGRVEIVHEQVFDVKIIEQVLDWRLEGA